MEPNHDEKRDLDGPVQIVEVPAHHLIHAAPPLAALMFMAILFVGSSKDPAVDAGRLLSFLGSCCAFVPRLFLSDVSGLRAIWQAFLASPLFQVSTAGYSGVSQHFLYTWMCLLLSLATAVAIFSWPLICGMRQEIADLLRNDFPVTYVRWLGDSHILHPTYLYQRTRRERRDFKGELRKHEDKATRSARILKNLRPRVNFEAKAKVRVTVNLPCRCIYIVFWVTCMLLVVVFGSNALPRVSVVGRALASLIVFVLMGRMCPMFWQVFAFGIMLWNLSRDTEGLCKHHYIWSYPQGTVLYRRLKSIVLRWEALYLLICCLSIVALVLWMLLATASNAGDCGATPAQTLLVPAYDVYQSVSVVSSIGMTLGLAAVIVLCVCTLVFLYSIVDTWRVDAYRRIMMPVTTGRGWPTAADVRRLRREGDMMGLMRPQNPEFATRRETMATVAIGVLTVAATIVAAIIQASLTG